MHYLCKCSAVGLALAAVAAGCGGSGSAQGARVLAAASLTEVFQKVDPSARFSFAGSDELARQIREGAQADVYASANARYPDELFAEGLVEEPEVFASNRLVVIVPSGNPAGIESVEDVAEPGVELLVAAEGVPAGDYTRDVLADLGLERALDNVVSNEDDVRGVAGKVALGEADAGFVYVTDAAPVEDDVAVVELPEGAQPPIEYEIAVVASSENAEAARAFVERVLGPEGRAALERAGFSVP
jgi:molybdate transport system substrate-binding protein